jgi:PAT family acetyl-CoA transporter-like MFS transporter 1
MAAISMATIAACPKEITNLYFGVVVFSSVLNSFFGNIQFVGISSFFSKISDPSIGGTYMTLLNTISNLGGTWPGFFVMVRLTIDF